LIDDLLQLSRVGRLDLDLETIDLTSLVQSISDNLAVQIQNHKIDIHIESHMPTVMADRMRVFQVFENLIINAIKYAGHVENPKIEIGGIVFEKETHFFVKDNGPGIAPEYHKKIFGLFQRLESDKRGTGVGLTIVSRVMQLHEGRVWVESEVGKGSTFWLAFPKELIARGDSENE
jgi:two-component system sensor kinase FixL